MASFLPKICKEKVFTEIIFLTDPHPQKIKDEQDYKMHIRKKHAYLVKLNFFLFATNVCRKQ